MISEWGSCDIWCVYCGMLYQDMKVCALYETCHLCPGYLSELCPVPPPHVCMEVFSAPIWAYLALGLYLEENLHALCLIRFQFLRLAVEH